MAGAENVRKVLESQEVLDQLATVEHERWAHWQQYMHDQCDRQDDGSLVIPPYLVQRWERSEERRVGKEGRARGARGPVKQETKQTQRQRGMESTPATPGE